MSTEKANKNWNNLPIEIQRMMQDCYNSHKIAYESTLIDNLKDIYDKNLKVLEDTFGKDNLDPQPQINTWNDLMEIDKTLDPYCGNPLICCIKNKDLQEKIKAGNEASIKLAKLIDEFYGGVITDEEWRDINIPKYCIGVQDDKILTVDTNYNSPTLLAFHTQDNRDRFITHPENVELIKKYM